MTQRSALIGTALILVVALALTFAARGGAGSESDIAAIKKNSTEFQAAWNTHDPKAIAAFWANDGDLIDPWGKTSVGRAAVESFFTGEHTGNGPLAKCAFEIKKDSVRMIASDVALEDWEVILTGLKAPDATAPAGPMFHRVVIVRKKEGDKWLFAAVRPGLPEPVKQPGAPAKPKS